MAQPIIQLERCPFCGGEGYAATYERRQHYIICKQCMAETAGYDTVFEAVAAWNQRNGGGNNDGK